MQKGNIWISQMNKTITSTKHALSQLSIHVRTDQFKLFESIFKPSRKTKILDVGVSSDETLPDTNMFEKLYPYPSQLTAATIEDIKTIHHLYPKIHVKRITPKKKLPFRDKEFDIVVSWATIEHVGNYTEQSNFLAELTRVGKHIFVTTPYRGCIYEPHTGLFFFHWLPLSIFRFVLKKMGKDIWATDQVLNPLWKRDIQNMKTNARINIHVYKMYNFLPSHLIVVT